MNRDEKLMLQRSLVEHLRACGEIDLARKYDTQAIKAKRTYVRDAQRFSNATQGHRVLALFNLRSLSL
jgi:hypothetical protein